MPAEMRGNGSEETDRRGCHFSFILVEILEVVHMCTSIIQNQTCESTSFPAAALSFPTFSIAGVEKGPGNEGESEHSLKAVLSSHRLHENMHVLVSNMAYS